jgi:hypothetical protein
MNENMYLKNGLFLCLTCLVLQSCTAYSVLTNYKNKIRQLQIGESESEIFINFKLFKLCGLSYYYQFCV